MDHLFFVQDVEADVAAVFIPFDEKLPRRASNELLGVQSA
jgi:hypothetical protein